MTESLLQRLRRHGWQVDDVREWCFWCLAIAPLTDDDHKAGCLWLEVVAATDRPSDDLGLPGGRHE